MKSSAEKSTMKRVEREAHGVLSSAGSSRVTLTSSFKVVRITMDLFQHRYYRLNKILMTLIGQWPYQSTRARCGFVAAIVCLGGNQIIPQLTALVKHHDDETIVLDVVVGFLFGAVSVTKLIGFIWNSKRTLKLVNRIRTDWHEWAGDREINILHRYAKQGRRMTIAYLVMNIVNHSVFMIQPSIPKIIDVLLNNGSEPGKFPYPVDFYHLDVQKYYFYIIVYSYTCSSFVTMIVATNGVMLICYVQHVCGIFAMLGHKLEQLGNNRTLGKTREIQYELDKTDILVIASCIDRHNDAIEFSVDRYVNLMVASYSWIFFFTIVIGTMLFNIIGLQVLMRTNDPVSTTRYIFFALSIILYFYVDCYISEIVTDHSINIYFYIQNSQWYKLSLEAQKCLQFMIMRCNVPCHFTAGRMLIMSMRSFWLTSKTGISYLMLLRSTQGL